MVGRAAVLALAIVCLAGCERKTKAPEKQAAASPRFEDTALFLAGLPGRANGPFHAAEQTPAWRKYSDEFSKTWEHAQTEQFQAVDAFQHRELATLNTNSSFIFYPFSGPDILYAYHFFPNAKTYVLAGLERVGSMRNPEDYTKDIDKQMNNWSQALASIFNRSFFVTREMDSQFHGRVANGLLPMLLLLMARSGDVIDSVRYGHLDDNGTWVPEDDNPDVRHMGAEIRFHKSNENAPRLLYYFSTRLDFAFGENPAFERFLLNQGKPDTLIKSASFLLHWKMCAAIREYILKNSSLILEDDTGVPYAYLQNAVWKVSLFGEYSKPDRPFRKEYQKDLAKAFDQRSNVRPLGFSIGYGSGRRPSSLILAVRSN
jgi:hypothetical protein